MATPFAESVARAAQAEAERQNADDVRKPQTSLLEKVGTPAFLAGAGADWISTAMALSNPRMQEDNPTINWIPSTAGKIAAGATQDFVGYLLAKKLLKNHPKLLNAGLLVSGGLRGALAARNLHRLSEVK